MVVFDIRDYGDLRRKAQEHAAILIRFNDESASLSHMGIITRAVELAANNVRRIVASLAQQMDDHGSRGCFTVRACNGDLRFIWQELPEELAARQDRQPRASRRNDFSVIFRHR